MIVKQFPIEIGWIHSKFAQNGLHPNKKQSCAWLYESGGWYDTPLTALL
jgi:hypothetical protein